MEGTKRAWEEIMRDSTAVNQQMALEIMRGELLVHYKNEADFDNFQNVGKL